MNQESQGPWAPEAWWDTPLCQTPNLTGDMTVGGPSHGSSSTGGLAGGTWENWEAVLHVVHDGSVVLGGGQGLEVLWAISWDGYWPLCHGDFGERERRRGQRLGISLH